MINIEIIGKKIKKYRRFKELSQTKLARIVGVSRGTIANIESGKTIPKLFVLVNIAAALEVDISILTSEN